MPTQTAIDAVVARLADVDDGYNFHIEDLCADRGIQDDLTLDFGTIGENVFLAHVAPQAWVSSSEQRFPTAFVFVNAVVNTGRIQPTLFSGNLEIGIDIVLGAWTSRPPVNFEAVKAAVTDAMIRVFHAASSQHLAAGVVYGGRLSVQIPALQFGGPNWMSVLSVRIPLIVEI